MICLLTGHPECLSPECAAGRAPCARARAPVPSQPPDLFRRLQATGAIETYRAPQSWLRRMWLALT